MIRQLVALSAIAAFAAISWAQTSNTPPNGSSGQTTNGILMDASCAALRSASPGVSSYSAGGTATAATPGSVTQPAQPGAGVSQSGVTHSGAHPGSTDALSQTRVTERANQTIAGTPAVTPQPDPANNPATGIAGPGTGAATTARTDPAAEAAGTAARRDANAVPAATPGEGTRAREVDQAAMTTVREKYKDCKVSGASSAFAIYSNGNVTLLDDASNTMMKTKLTSDSSMAARMGTGEWMTVSLAGSMEGGKLKVSSINPNR